MSSVASPFRGNFYLPSLLLACIIKYFHESVQLTIDAGHPKAARKQR